MARRALIAGNWKMHGLKADLGWVETFVREFGSDDAPCDLLVCPPATLLAAMSDALSGSPVATGGQDCSAEPEGAFTGDLSAKMIRDAGADYVIVGHSERRAGHEETDEDVREKAAAALACSLVPVICVGESLEQRDSGEAEAVVTGQLRACIPECVLDRPQSVVIAYEPVWAIGTGRTASPDDIQTMHAALRAAWPGAHAERLRVIYGGSVKPANAAGILARPDVDGALVGGASLDASDFAAIANAVR